MTVNELIAELLKYDGNLVVVVEAYEVGYNDLDDIQEINVTLNANAKPLIGGKHESDEDSTTGALLLR